MESKAHSVRFRRRAAKTSSASSSLAEIKSSASAKYKYARISSKKVAPVMDLVRGKNVEEAKMLLAFGENKASVMVLKVLRSAIANAINTKNLTEKDLFVSHIQVDGGPSLKRGRPASRGRYSPIVKRTSHIRVDLSVKNSAKGGKE